MEVEKFRELSVSGGPDERDSILQQNLDQEHGESIALLVLERGAEWPTWGTGIRMRAINSAVEVQMDSESIDEFRQRVQARLTQIAKKRMRLVAAGYACALAEDDRRECRKELCTRILTGLADEDGSELILAGGSWETTGRQGRQRAELIELWGELSIQVPGRLMSVRFEDPPSQSGVFPASEKLTAPDSDNFSEIAETVLTESASESREPGAP